MICYYYLLQFCVFHGRSCGVIILLFNHRHDRRLIMGSVFPVRLSAHRQSRGTPDATVWCCEIQGYVCHMFPPFAAHEFIQKVCLFPFFEGSFYIYNNPQYTVPWDFPKRFHIVMHENSFMGLTFFAFLVYYSALSEKET